MFLQHRGLVRGPSYLDIKLWLIDMQVSLLSCGCIEAMVLTGISQCHCLSFLKLLFPLLRTNEDAVIDSASCHCPIRWKQFKQIIYH